MPIKYDPKDAQRCVPEGDYDATLEKVEDSTSSKGNAMQIVTWRVYGPEGREHLIPEYVVAPSTIFKLQQIATALGHEDEFASGEFQADNHVGENLVVKLKIEKATGEFPEKNRIAAYKPKTGTGRIHRNAPPANGRTQYANTERPAFAPPGNADNEIPF